MAKEKGHAGKATKSRTREGRLCTGTVLALAPTEEKILTTLMVKTERFSKFRHFLKMRIL